ncbi:MAG: Asp-tRNA(Asn)/Glu-tRNA(Gln) amidotransferase subunit GatC [Alphaproteobacteria bacterium]|jgi:aspartyl-tRNA(Asn)/glutamyl-tRNA(Gln) amidotransferase subunit C|nr:Asp-tRNA(Asn)/Glu-tRNA(Gln) amidotransferase subunit GatC [Alphaproteobacteria bacterium]
MSFSNDDVKKVAKLSRIRIDDKQLEQYTNDIQKVLGFMEQLNELNTDNVEPMANPLDGVQVLRNDEIKDGGYPETIVNNATDDTMNFFTVPKVVE